MMKANQAANTVATAISLLISLFLLYDEPANTRVNKSALDLSMRLVTASLRTPIDPYTVSYHIRAPFNMLFSRSKVDRMHHS